MKLRGVISLRKAFPIWPMPKGTCVAVGTGLLQLLMLFRNGGLSLTPAAHGAGKGEAVRQRKLLLLFSLLGDALGLLLVIRSFGALRPVAAAMSLCYHCAVPGIAARAYFWHNAPPLELRLEQRVTSD